METCNCLEVLHFKLMSSSSTCIPCKPVEVSPPSLRHYFVFLQLSCGCVPVMLCNPKRVVPLYHDLLRPSSHQADEDLSLPVAPALVFSLYGQAKLLDSRRERGTVEVRFWCPVSTGQSSDMEVFAKHYHEARQDRAETLAGSSQPDYLFWSEEVCNAAQHQLW